MKRPILYYNILIALSLVFAVLFTFFSAREYRLEMPNDSHLAEDEIVFSLDNDNVGITEFKADNDTVSCLATPVREGTDFLELTPKNAEDSHDFGFGGVRFYCGPFNTIFVITMFFGGGLIPTYLLISNLGMLDTIWALLLPGAFSVWNMIIARTYYMGIPRDLQEAAEIDGATEMIYFFKILLPVCTPIIATIAMWQFVGMWNSYFDAMIYLNSASKQPLQLVLRAILIQSQPQPGMVSDMQSTAARAQLAELLKYATIIISSLPLMIMYPFFQKYFDNGIMAGAVKG